MGFWKLFESVFTFPNLGHNQCLSELADSLVLLRNHDDRSASKIEFAMTFEVCILTGGQSSRMKRDKTQLRYGGRTLLGHVRQTAQQLCAPVRVIRKDVVPQCGPLGGIYTAFQRSRADVLLFLSCDMPFVSVKLLRSIVSRMRRGGAAAVFVASGDARRRGRKKRDSAAASQVGFPFALRRITLRVIERMLNQERLSLQELATTLQAERMRLPNSKTEQLFNVNTPEDWNDARLMWKRNGRKQEL